MGHLRGNYHVKAPVEERKLSRGSQDRISLRVATKRSQFNVCIDEFPSPSLRARPFFQARGKLSGSCAYIQQPQVTAIVPEHCGNMPLKRLFKVEKPVNTL